MNIKSFSIKLAAAALLMLVCLFAAGGMKASAATAITRAEISIDAPENGKTVDFTPTITEGTGFNVSTTATESRNYYDYDTDRTFSHVLRSGVGWYNVTDKKAEAKTGKYASNHEYSLMIKLVAKSGYYFDAQSFCASINGKTAGATYTDSNSSGFQTVYLELGFEYFDYDLYDIYLRSADDTVRVTGGNASDILGDGMFSYDAKTRTLNINSGTYDAQGGEGILIRMTGVTISVNGNATITNCLDAIVFDYNATITGKGKLTIKDCNWCGIMTNGSLTIKNTSLDITSGAESIMGDVHEDHYDATLTIDNSDITAVTTGGDDEYPYPVIAYFTSGLKLNNCTLKTPSGGKYKKVVYDEEQGIYESALYTSDGKEADKLKITRNGEYIGYSKITIPYSSYTYRGRGIKPTVTVKDGSTKLVKGTDYTVSYSNNTNVGTATITVTGKGKYAGTYKKTFKVKALDLSSSYAKISIPYSSYTYTGSAIKPAVTVKFKDGDVIPTSDYTVSYSNNKNVGVATITVKGKGTNVTGTYKKTFVVKPAKNEITSISTTSGAFKIAWKKGTTGTVGYQVQYSTDKNFEKNVHSWTTTNISKLSENFSSVPRSGETWYVKVRSFYTKDGKTSSTRYGNYSAVKSIKIK
ncbi:MAG: hypothetical protein IKO44_04690 [Ruminococcus sp.]|nr:hypothetical protein [Ruminococcus sp.]MBR4622818.1 hypothetical protein [Ruminococcus sp.]